MARFDTDAGAQGRRIGRYEVLGEIASGGMATVYLARSMGAKGFSRLVAIKRLHPHLEAEEDFVQMFLDEARLAARIRHPNVVATLDVEDSEGLYIVMEYIEGVTLLMLWRAAQKMNEKIPVPVVARVVLDTLGGLHAAHELLDDSGEFLGLVHRDVSPQNILIGTDGSSRLTDFGIAKATSRLTMTRDGQLKGKISYMAPEQTKRVELDRRVDLFAMGICTWELLAGKRLFQGESDVEVLNQLLFEPIPRLKDHAPSIPAALEQTVMKALERDPTQRYGSASEFGDAIEKAMRVLGGPANHRAVASFVQKVAGERIARERGRIASGASPSESGTGSWKAVDAPPVTPSRVRNTAEPPPSRGTPLHGSGPMGARPGAPLSQGRYAVPAEGSHPRPKPVESPAEKRPRPPTLAGAPIAPKPSIPPRATPSLTPPRAPTQPVRSKAPTMMGTGASFAASVSPGDFDPGMPTAQEMPIAGRGPVVIEPSQEFEAPAPGEATLIESSPQAFIARHLAMSRGAAPDTSEEIEPEPDESFHAAPTPLPPANSEAPTQPPRAAVEALPLPSIPQTQAMPASAPAEVAAPSFAPLPANLFAQAPQGPSLGPQAAPGGDGWSLGGAAPAPMQSWQVSAPPVSAAPTAAPSRGRGVLVGVAIAALVASAAVVGWSQLRGRRSPQPSVTPPVPTTATVVSPPLPALPTPSVAPPATEPAPVVPGADAAAAVVPAVVDAAVAAAPAAAPEPAPTAPEPTPVVAPPAAPEPARTSGEPRHGRHHRSRDPDDLEISPLVRDLPPASTDGPPTRAPATPAPTPTPAPQRAPRRDPDPDAPDLGNPYRN